ncbi:type II toxin-antitoxin system YafQ family toxin [Flavobacterium sp. ZT3R18]|uniref:type II toxin-antitoxin system RelE/ParE family toxin n=1 Tax=Flavobacterium sp. ZT3R18 TaxID=2594429 RepID=UPI00117A619D|nr:type II toxin-antitoxin system YafQ family toxin [Flavobacterium sp. ZT3R18]TRX37984.1 type II toxin-antitoxin system YafQ family toxin [Flavobacterium sp. ZT3R18]
MYELIYASKFKKDVKLCQKRNYDFSEFKKIISELESTGEASAKYRPHTLSGDYAGCWECHIKPDWLLIWYYVDGNTIYLARTGTHSDLFK